LTTSVPSFRLQPRASLRVGGAGARRRTVEVEPANGPAGDPGVRLIGGQPKGAITPTMVQISVLIYPFSNKDEPLRTPRDPEALISTGSRRRRNRGAAGRPLAAPTGPRRSRAPRRLRLGLRGRPSSGGRRRSRRARTGGHARRARAARAARGCAP